MKYQYHKQYAYRTHGDPWAGVLAAMHSDLDWCKLHFGMNSSPLNSQGRWGYSDHVHASYLMRVYYFLHLEDHALFVLSRCS